MHSSRAKNIIFSECIIEGPLLCPTQGDGDEAAVTPQPECKGTLTESLTINSNSNNPKPTLLCSSLQFPFDHYRNKENGNV